MVTKWTQNTAKSVGTLTYSDSVTTYNSSTVKYAGINVTLPEDGNVSDIWTRTSSNPARWSANTALVGTKTYSSANLTYNDALTLYAGVNVLLSYDGKLAGMWSKYLYPISYGSHPALNGTVMYGGNYFPDGIAWNSNVAANANQYAYDSTKLFDNASDTYDGIVVGQNPSGSQVPTRWT